MDNYILIDSHVHLHPSWDLEQFLNCAHKNFQKFREAKNSPLPLTAVLMLTESLNLNRFAQIKNNIANSAAKTITSGKWQLSLTEEKNSLSCTLNNQDKIIIIAGRQIISQEGLEVLALGTEKEFKPGLSLNETIEQILEQKALPVMTWGVGKWLGKRGKIIKKLIHSPYAPKIFLGDIGGRPFFWAFLSLFKQARAKKIKILRGSDPLALEPQIHKVGSFGFSLKAELNPQKPGKDLLNLLRKPDLKPKPYGKPANLLNFFTVQLQIRIKKNKKD